MARRSPLTAATSRDLRKIVDPPEGITSARQSFYVMVDKNREPGPQTVVFRSNSRPARSSRRSPIPTVDLQKGDPRQGPRGMRRISWLRPFKFVSYDAGQAIKGERNPIIITRDCLISTGSRRSWRPSRRHVSMRSQRPRGDSSSRLSAAARDELVGSLGDRITVETAIGIAACWHAEPQEKALTMPRAPRPHPGGRPLARRAGLSKIAIMRTVGGIVFPGSHGRDKGGLEQLAGFWPTSTSHA